MANLNKKRVFISFISIIWCIVSIWAISIFTIFQANADNQINYQWFDNNAWVLKNLNFSKSWDITNITNSFYMKNNNIILKIPNVIVPSSENIEYINSWKIILWWLGNKTNSLNPIIWWNYISSSWDNTAFWGENITIEWKGTSYWWKENTITWNNTVIWWENNKAEWEENIIMWWKEITVWWNNNIAAWERITNNYDNTFIFNNNNNYTTFTPQTWNAFYINSQWGLWINWDSNNDATVIHGWLSIWEIDINNWCNENNDIGIIWVDNNCLLACTEYSLNSWRSLIENSQRCTDWCKDQPKCINPPVIPDVEPDPYPAYCTWTVFSWATPCFHNYEPETYTNVVFTYNYVNECPNSQEKLDNPCTYKCPAWYSFGDWTCKKSCTITWNNGEKIIVPHWESIVLYQQKNPTCPSKCLPANRKCDNWNFEWWITATYRYLSCEIQIRTGNQCDDTIYNIEENEKTAWWKYTACTWYTINWNSCTPYVKYKLDKCNTGYTFTWWTCHKNCIFNWISVEYWKTITWYKYKNSNCKDQNWYLCNSNTLLKCGEWWSFWPEANTYQFTWCNRIGENCSGYNLDNCPSNWICSICTWYRLSNNSCNQFIKYKLDSCNTWYTKDWDACKADCQLPRWGNIKHNDTIKWYKNNLLYCPNYCEEESNKKTMKCDDGKLEWSWTYIYSWCTTKALSGENFNRTTKINNAICERFTWYNIRFNTCVDWQTKYKCTECQSWYTRNGEDWNWNNVKCLKDCEFTALPNNRTVHLSWNGWSIKTYKTWYFICPSYAEDNYQIRICNNWLLNGNYVYTNYIQTWSSCVSENTDTIKTFTNQLRNEVNRKIIMIKSCRGSTYNWNTCSNETTHYTYKCRTGYIRAQDNSKCIGCEWIIPENAHKNNDNFPNNNDSINYYYNTNTSMACTFSCDNGFSRNETLNQCVSNDKKCYLDWIEYTEWSQKYLYNENNPICSNSCKSITALCKNGSRRNINNDTTATWYTSCSATWGYVMSNSEPQIWTCPKNHGNVKAFTWLRLYLAQYNNDNNDYSVYQWLCKNYSSPDKKNCVLWTTYYYYYCPSGWSGNNCYSNCTHNGKEYPHWTTLTMYNRWWRALCLDIQSETRKCNNGKRTTWWLENNFSEGFIFTGYIGIWNNCTWFSSTKPNNWSTYETCEKYKVVNWKCVSEGTTYKETGCPQWFSKIWTTCKPNCYLDGKTIKYWETITGYQKMSNICPQECAWITRTCTWKILGDNSLTWFLMGNTSYKYSHCSNVWRSCSNTTYPYTDINDIPVWTNIEICTWYIRNNNSCDTYTRYKINNCSSWYTRIESEGECKKNCIFTGSDWTINYVLFWKSITTYFPTECPWPCNTWKLICKDNWNFEWVQWMSYCQLHDKICSSDFNLNNCPNKWICETCTWYNYTNNPNNKCQTNYKRKLIWCQSGYTKVWDNCFKDCELPRWGSIAHNSSTEARKFVNGECKRINRQCYDGTLLWDSSYNLKSCSTCQTPRNTYVASWQNAIWYKEKRCTTEWSASCPFTGRTCKNWSRYLWNTIKTREWYTNEKCTITAWETQTCTNEYNLTSSQKIPGWIYNDWCKKYQYNESTSSCEGQEYFKFIWCKSGYVEGWYNICYTWCRVREKNYQHWSTVTWYKKSSVKCTSPTTECEYEIRICRDWTRYNTLWQTAGFADLYETCSTIWESCNNYPLTYATQTDKCEYQQCDTYDNSCNKGNPKYALTHVETWYYATGNTCNSICGAWTNNTLCNWWYTPSWVSRQLPDGRRVNLYWTQYVCKKSNNWVKWVDEYQCGCYEWYTRNGNGTWCIYYTHSLCNNEQIKWCYSSYPIDYTTINWWATWKCINGTTTSWELCHLCNTNYKRNKQTKTCEKVCDNGKTCEWIKPEWEWVVKGNGTIVCNGNWIQWYGWWTYIDNPDAVNYACCSWSCKKWYVRDWNKCIKDGACWPAIEYANPWDNKKQLCNSWWQFLNGSTKIEYNQNTDGRRYYCEPKYTWTCQRWNETTWCINTNINKEDIYITISSIWSQNYWEIITNTDHCNYETTCTPGLKATIKYFTGVDNQYSMYPHPYGIMEKTLYAWNTIPSTEMEPIYRIIKIDYNPLYSNTWTFQHCNQDWIYCFLSPKWNSWSNLFDHGTTTICPEGFNIDI